MSSIHPFANAPVLPFDLARSWIRQAGDVLRLHPGSVLLAAALVMLARWQLDFFDRAAVIVLSYLSDAIIFCSIYAGIQAVASGQASSIGAGARSALRGRWKGALISSLWGLPAAALSHALFQGAPELIKALILTLGVNALGVAALLLLILLGGYLTFLLSLLPVLAAIHATRDTQAGFKVSGLWAFRAMHSGWRPLLAIFMAFITACFVAGGLLSALFGHLPPAWLEAHPGWSEGLSYWYPWPGLLVAMVLFVALLHPMARDLLQAADVDLSDEILHAQEKDGHGDRFVYVVLQRLAWGLRSVAVLCLLFGLLYAGFFGADAFYEWTSIALVIYMLNFIPRWWARRFRTADLPPSNPPA